MRVSNSLALALLCATLVSATLIEQVTGFPWLWPHPPQTTTIIDLLSTNAEFAPLLKVLQRMALVPLLNTVQNITLIAPIAKAFDGLEDVDITRDLMMYHILNASVLSEMVETEIVFESLLRMDPKDNLSAGVGVRVEQHVDRVLTIGGTRVVKSDWEASNGVIQVVDSLVRIPNSIESNLDKLEFVSTFNGFLKDTSFPRRYSLFVPDDSSFHVLHPVELSYLKTKFGKADCTNLLYRHASKDILYGKVLKEGGNTTSLEGEKIYFKTKGSQILIDNVKLTHPDIVSTNGVIHQISDLLIPESLIFTPLKYLYGLHDFIFAETLKASGYAHLANDLCSDQTIFAPMDKAYADEIDTTELLKQVQYNFLMEKMELPPYSTRRNNLFETRYKLASLDGAGQKIKLSRRLGDKYFLNDEVELIPKKVKVGNTYIYEITGNLSPPGPLRPTVVGDVSLFRSFRHLAALKLDQRILFDETAITVLLPDDRAWAKLGLAEKYLLSEAAGNALEKIMLSCVLKGVYYFADFNVNGKEYATLSGEKVTIFGTGLHVPGSRSYAYMDRKDILANNGVGHSLLSVPIPASVQITPEALIKATGQTAWLELLHKANFTHFLDLGSNYTLLIPTNRSLSASPVDPSLYIPNHVIPPRRGYPRWVVPSNPQLETLSGVPLEVSHVYGSGWMIKTGASQTARILDFGDTSAGSQVVLIDTVLWKSGRRSKWDWVKLIAAVIFAVAVCVVVVSGVMSAVKWWRRQREEKPPFVEGPGDEEEQEPLLDGNV